MVRPDKPVSLIIRADAGPRVGIGHFMRCFALAMEWRSRGGNVLFVSHCESDLLSERISNAHMKMIPVERPHPDPHDLDTLTEAVDSVASGSHRERPVWLVLDGYHFGPEYQKAVARPGVRVMIVDDMAHHSSYRADLILNQNIHAHELVYDHAPHTRLVLGPSFALLRREFAQWSEWWRQIPLRVTKVLVTLGGSDPDNVTHKVLQGISLLGDPEMQVKIVAGPAASRVEALRRAAALDPMDVTILSDVSNMPQWMAWADLAISGAGSTCWELAFMTLPSLLLVLAENQRPIAEALDAAGIARNLGNPQQISPEDIARHILELSSSAEKRQLMAANGRALVDGDGAKRIVSLMRSDRITLRPVCENDRTLLWKWVNDSEVRRGSFSGHAISWEEHSKWFSARFGTEDFLQFIALDEGKDPVGQIRFEREDRVAVVSVSIDSQHRGLGYCCHLISEAVSRVVEQGYVDRVLAYVKPDNVPSLKCFVKAGFVDHGPCVMKDQSAIELEWSRPDRGQSQNSMVR